jgi:hypothetical protein
MQDKIRNITIYTTQIVMSLVVMMDMNVHIGHFLA